MFGLTVCAGRLVRRLAAIAAVSLLFAAAGAPVSAQAEVRTLKFYNLHTHERGEFTYKRNGRYVASEMKRINWFLRDWRRKEPTRMDPRLMDLIWEAYRQSGSNEYINVICGYRAPATNAMLRSRTSGVAKKSQHTLGKALDFFIPDVPLKKLREIGLKMQVGGVGYYPKSGSPFVHFDVGSARHWPRMSRKELAAVFPNGGTVHIPSDGKPLPGYQQALASYKQRVSASSIQVANAKPESSGGGRSLLAVLFGGGADEEEDDAMASAPAPRAPVRAAPRREVQVAAIPSRKPQLLEAGVALPVRDDFDVSAPTPQADIPEETQVAALDVSRVPLPSPAPQRGAPSMVPPASGDAVSTLVAALETQAAEEVAATPVPGKLAYSVPTPRDRPPFETILKGDAPTPESIEAVKEIVTAAVTPAPRPEALASRPADNAGAGLMLPASQKTARPAATLAATGVSTSPSGKTGRVLRSQPRPAPQPVTIGVQEAIESRIEIAALVTDPDLRARTAVTAKPTASPQFREAPTAVFTTGFAQGRSAPAADHFSGSAIKFLPVAKFD